MAGTFEIIFSGLCLFLLGGVSEEGYTGVEVNLLHTAGGAETVCKEDGSAIVLHEHTPYLVIPRSGWDVKCSGSPMGDCKFQLMSCKNGQVEDAWFCPIQGRELCVAVDPEISFELVPGRDGLENVPEEEDKSAFDWISHLERIDGTKIARLKGEVGAPIILGRRKNRLIASRVSSTYGKLSTKSLGYDKDAEKSWTWKVKPDEQPGFWWWQKDHPKALSEAMSLNLGNAGEVKLFECGQGDKYWWNFTSVGEKNFTIRVQNLAQKMCKDNCASDHPCTVCNGGPKNRLRHFLWYYELVEWEGGECPKYHSAPICPDSGCRKNLPDYLYGQDEAIRGDANHFCPPTTYP